MGPPAKQRMVSEYMAKNYTEREIPVAAEEPRGVSGSLSDRVRSLRLKEKTARPPAKSSKLPWLLCVVLVGCCAALAYIAFVRSDRERSDASAALPPGDGKSAETARRDGATASSGEVVLERKGYIIPAHQILVSPKVSGMIVQLGNGKRELEEGMRVQKDEILARLESVD